MINNEQIQALKSAAESVIQAHGDDWFQAGTQVCTVHKSKISLIAAAKPADILSLLAERDADKAQIAELQAFKTAFLEWSDKTNWVQTDKRFEVLIPWGKHRADVLKEYIEHLEAKTITVNAADVLSVPEGSHNAAGRMISFDVLEEYCAAAGITLVVGE